MMNFGDKVVPLKSTLRLAYKLSLKYSDNINSISEKLKFNLYERHLDLTVSRIGLLIL
jgi:hypothetical protein